MSIGTAFGRIGGTQAARGAQVEDALCSSLTNWRAKRPRWLQGEFQKRRWPAQMQICNACRYCETFCAVFPAMTRRLEFGVADVPLPGEPVPQLWRVPARVPVRAAA